MATRAIGLDIGTSGVRGAQVSFDRRGATLERFGHVALPAGAVRQGEVHAPDQVASALEELWSQAKFDTKRVAVGIANRRVVVRQVDLPALPAQELKAGLPFLAQDYIPMPVDRAVLDVHVLQEVTGPNGAPMLRGLLVAASSEMVEQTLEAVRAAGLKPVSVDLTPFAVLRALGQADVPLDSAGDAEVLVDVGASVTNIIVHQGGVPHFIRILLMGGSDATESIAARLGISYEDAENLKLALSAGADVTTTEQELAAAVLDSTTEAFCEEIRTSLAYFTGATSSVRLSRLVLTGGGAGLVGLGDHIARETRLPVVRADVLDTLRVAKKASGATTSRDTVAVPVGLALAVA